MVNDLKNDDSGEYFSISKGESGCKGMSKSNRFNNLRVNCFTYQNVAHFVRDCSTKRGYDDFVQIVVTFDKDIVSPFWLDYIMQNNMV